MNVRHAIPLLIQEGWTRHQEEVAKPPLTERTGWSRMEPLLRNAFRNTAAIPTTPSAPLRWLRIFFLMAQPPLLYQEGNGAPNSSITPSLTARAMRGGLLKNFIAHGDEREAVSGRAHATRTWRDKSMNLRDSPLQALFYDVTKLRMRS